MSSIDPAIRTVLQARSAEVDQQIQYALAARALRAVERQGETALRMLQATSQPGKSHAKGDHFDAIA